MAFGAVIFPAIDSIAKYLGQDIPILQILLARYFFQAALLLPIVLLASRKSAWKNLDLRTNVAQAVALMAAAGFYYSSLRYLSLAAASILSFMSPLIVIILARFVLKENATGRQWCAVAAGVIGACFILQPTGNTGSIVGSILALCSAAANAIYLILIRRSRLRSSPLINAVMSGGIISLFLSMAMPVVWQIPTQIEWILLVAIGFAGAIAQSCVIFAYQNGVATKLAPLAFIELLGAIILSIVVFGDLPTGRQLIGASIILSGVVLTITR